ncbi:MAG: Grx4 family monothiol glutaredoxin [Deltaproteobacteria bacterium]|nr:Grx4 family monothiol glutaredoxin [Deltaproteobacteria bacterium]
MDDTQRAQLQQLVSKSKVVLFMKGTKNFPQCGFSGTVIQILVKVGVPFETVNILADADVRQGMKEFSDWPTFPQLYIDAQFVGGADIVRDMYSNGELQKLLGQTTETAS